MASRLVFLGPPGTGKGTQAQRLARRLGSTPLSSGDVLRKEMADGSPIGRHAAGFVNSGRLVPDDVITGVMLAAIDKLPRGGGFVLDGFPRTVPQALALSSGLAERSADLDAVVDFELADAKIIERLSGRRVCKNCAATYNVRSLPPRAEGVCDRCGAPLVQRPDDREEVIATRLATYHAQTEPLIEFYRQRGLLREVDAGAEPAEVEARIVAIVNELSGSA